MFMNSPGKTRSFQQPLSLPGLAKRLEEGTHLCLTSPFPYYNGCKVRFDADLEGLPATAIHEARATLKDILGAGSLVEKCNLRKNVARLIKVAQAFCCSKHREDWELMEDFAYYWVAFEYTHCFPESIHWEWDDSRWQCLASDHHADVGYLNKLDKADRDTVYRSLNQLVVYTAFSDESDDLDDVFLHKAIVNLTRKWTCADHRKCPDIMKAIQTNLEEDIRNATLKSKPVHSAEHTSSSSASSSPGSASICTRLKSFFSNLSPTDSVTSIQDSGNSNSDSQRRKSAPTELPSFYSEPKTAERPPPVRSTASDAQASLESSTIDSLTSRASTPAISPSPAPSNTIEFTKFYKSFKEPRTVFNEVLNLVRQPASTNQNLYQDGWIYVLQIPDYKEYVKIGRTTQRMDARIRQIKKCRSGLMIKEIGCEFNSKVSYHERLEKIIHADLYNERCYFSCSCKRSKSRGDSHKSEASKIDSHQDDGLTKHGEWFKMDAQEAIERVEKWRTWMRQEPYESPGSDREGELKQDFVRRVDFFEKQRISDDPSTWWQEFRAPLNMTPGPNTRQDKRRRWSGVFAQK